MKYGICNTMSFFLLLKWCQYTDISIVQFWLQRNSFLEELISLLFFWEMKAIPSVSVQCRLESRQHIGFKQDRENGTAQMHASKRTLECLVWETDTPQVLNWQLCSIVYAKQEFRRSLWRTDCVVGPMSRTSKKSWQIIMGRIGNLDTGRLMIRQKC